MAAPAPDIELSEASLPLINFLRSSDPEQSPEDLAALLHKVTIGVGDDPPPILVPDEKHPDKVPDESRQDKKWLLQLAKEGPPKPKWTPKVTIVGAGTSGLCAGYALKKSGYDVTILEASSRVGGRVITFREPSFAPGLHGEGGAMRIPKNHFLLRQYIEEFKLGPYLDFEMKNKFIYITGYPRTLVYDEFNKLLVNKDPELLALFPKLKEHEKGYTVDQLFMSATTPVVGEFWAAVAGKKRPLKPDDIRIGYKAITDKYDKYSLRSYLEEVAQWSEDAINLYDLANAHVVFENGFIESFKDAFLSSNDQGAQAQMQQLQNGMDAVPLAFIDPKRGKDSLIDNITFGARVRKISDGRTDIGIGQSKIKVEYETNSGLRTTIESNYLILAIPYTAQRPIVKTRAFDPKQEMAIRDVRYVEVTKVLLQYKTRWWNNIFESQQQGLDGGVVCDLPIRYTMFPKTEGNEQFKHSKRGVIMAAYTFEQDATILSALSPERRIQIAAENLDRIFPEAKSLELLEAAASQCFPSDELAGGSAFCYFGPMQKSKYLPTMMASDWGNTVFFAGEQASYSHGWIQGAFEAALRCVQQISEAAKEEIL